MVRLHPYQYVFYNALVGGPAGSLGVYDTEYWFTSTRYAMEKLGEMIEEGSLEQDEGEELGVWATGPQDVALWYLPDGLRLLPQGSGEAQLFIGNTHLMGHTLVEGRELFRIERVGLPIVVVKDLRR